MGASTSTTARAQPGPLLGGYMETMKCVVCGIEKPISEYYFRSDHKTRRYDCKQCVIEKSRIWRLANIERYRNLDNARHQRSLEKRREKERRCYDKYPERHREKRLQKEFGVTIEDFNRKLASQGNSCAICGTLSPNDGRNFHIDHCHKTGKLRGILCNTCNLMLGLAHDRQDVLLKAAEYLKAYASPESSAT
jgi:hypothetical protein